MSLIDPGTRREWVREFDKSFPSLIEHPAALAEMLAICGVVVAAVSRFAESGNWWMSLMEGMIVEGLALFFVVLGRNDVAAYLGERRRLGPGANVTVTRGRVSRVQKTAEN